MFVILCVLGGKAGPGESTFRFNYNCVQKVIHMLSLISQNQCLANIKCLRLLYKIFHMALDECFLGVISCAPGQTEVRKQSQYTS